MRVLILSADVAGGHDACARAVAALAEADEHVDEVVIDNGLAVCGTLIHRFVRDGYRAQLDIAEDSWSWLLRCVANPVGSTIARWFVGVMMGRRLLRHVRRSRADIVITTYPLLTIALSRQRALRRMRVPLVAVTTDPAPHELVASKYVDGLLVSTPGDVQRVREMMPRIRVSAIAPPISSDFAAVIDQAGARERIGLGLAGETRPVAVVSGGTWAVGGIEKIVDGLAADGRARVLVLCATNTALRARIEKHFCPSDVTALGFRTDMPDVWAASDVVIHAGAGVTGFEVLAAGRPLVIAEPISGHGVRSAEALHEDGYATFARTVDEAVELVCDDERRCHLVCGSLRCGEGLFARPDVWTATRNVIPHRGRAAPKLWASRTAATAAVFLACVVVGGEAQESNSAKAQAIGARVHRIGCVPFNHSHTSRVVDTRWVPGNC
ncbi:MAG: hypothetical protein H7123_00370 [Thermoleophilia bacterium]|nr:hypothetical protein [Thermoleophilia bacterium]